MRTELIEPCVNNISEKVDCEEILKQMEHLISEFEEVDEAKKDWQIHRDGKTVTHLAEELTDLATMCMTILEALECLPETDKVANFADSVLLMVNAKNYARGYHNSSEV